MIQRKPNSFTLIEMIGAMTILAVLAAILAPNIVRQIQTAKAAGEDQNLNTIANGILEFVNSTQKLPSTNVNSTTWASEVSEFTALSSNKILYVFPDQSYSRRILLYDTNFLAWGDLSTNVWQTNAKPNPARVMLVSSSSADTSLTVTGLTSADFTNLLNWNKIYSNGVVNVPTNLPSAWQKKGEFLHVTTVDLRPLFCRVELIDTACPPTATISNGTGYAVGDVITFNVGSYPFSFTATDTKFVGQAGNLAGNPPQMLTKPFSSSTTTDPRSGSRISGSSSGIDAIATLSSTPSPQFQLNNLAAQPFGAGNTMVFYVLKGTSLSLLNNAGVILNTFSVQGDSIFKYFNSTWSKVD